METLRNESQQTFMEKKSEEVLTNKDGHYAIPVLIYGLAAAGIILAGFNNTWAWAISGGALSIVIYGASTSFLPRLSGYAASLSLGILSAQLVFQMQKFPQLNIIFFIAASVLILYKQWKVFIPLAFVFITHQVIYLSINPSEIFQTLPVIIAFPVFLILVVIISFHLFKVQALKESIERKYQLQRKNLESNINYAKEIAAGNYEAANSSTSDDILGQSLIEMSKNLKIAAEEDKNRSWAMAGIARITEIIRNSNHDTEQLVNQLISYIVKYLGATQGSIFVINEGDGSKYLELKASYAYDRKKFIEKRIELGEGLVGQAVLEKESVYLTDIPQNYLRITSGLGGANPNALIIVPLKTEEDVVGVLEIASFNEFQAHQREFLEKASENIASSITQSKNNSHTTQLLIESQVLAEQLKAQEEELRQNMEELKATQEDIQRKNLEMEAAEKELTESKNYLHSVIDSIPNPVFVKDRDHKLIMINQAYCKLIQIPAESLMGKTDREIFPKEQAELFWNSDEQAFVTRKPHVSQEEIPSPDGNRTIITTKSTFETSSGLFLVGAIMDITERVALEQELHREKYLMEALMKSTSDNIYFKDLQSRFMRVSDNMAPIFKFDSTAGLIGKSDFDFFTKEHAQPAYDGEQEIIRTGKPIKNLIEKETWEGGKVTYASTTKMPLVDLNGKVVGTFGISRDVTETIKTELELKRKEALHKLILQNSSEICSITDKEGTITYLTPSFHKLMGYDENATNNAKIYDFIHEGDVKLLSGKIAELLASTTEKSIDLNLRYKTVNGSFIVMESILQNYTDENSEKGVVINSRRKCE
jgi:methyl-accepting chemotaxis protein